MKISQPKKSHKKLIITIVSVLLLAGIGTATFFILNKDNSSSNKESNTEVATNTDVASNTDVALNETTETTETVTTETVEEEPSEEPSVETPSENKPSTTPSNTTTETEKPSETPSTTETPSVPTTTETPSVPSEPTTTETTTETPSEPTPQPTTCTNHRAVLGGSYGWVCANCGIEVCYCGTPVQMMSGYIIHPAEGYYTQAIRFSNGEIFAPFNGDYNWVDEYMHNNGILSFSVADNYWVETTPEWREENVTRMCCPSCRSVQVSHEEGTVFVAY